MKNPWTSVPLSDYEAHMSLEGVAQLQAMDGLMRRQFETHSAAGSVLIFGVAGGNGLRHAERFRTVYGVDINPDYLAACRERYGQRNFVPVLADVADPACVLPRADLAVANLFVEYVGCAAFARALEKVGPRWVSLGIQLNEGEDFVCDSPYLHAFDGLEAVHVQMEEGPLTETLREAGFRLAGPRRIPLPQRKALLGLDYERV